MNDVVGLGDANEGVGGECGDGVGEGVDAGSGRRRGGKGEEEGAGEGGSTAEGGAEVGGELAGGRFVERAGWLDDDVVGDGDDGANRAGVEEGGVGQAGAEGFLDAEQGVFELVVPDDAGAGGGAVGVEDGFAATEFDGSVELEVAGRRALEGIVRAVDRVGEAGGERGGRGRARASATASK